MFHRSIFLMMVIAAAFIIIRNPQSASNRNIFIILLSLIAVITTQATTKQVESFEEKDEKDEKVESKPSDKLTENDRSEKEESKNTTLERSPTDQNIGLDNFDASFKDEFPKNFTGRQLVYYTSTFDRANVGQDNSLYNMKKSKGDVEHNKIQIPADVQYIIDQRDGLYINFKQPLTTVYPREIEFNTQEFTIMWYGKFVPVKYDTDVFKQHVYLVNVPVHDSTNIVAIELEFRSEYVNPTIKLHWKGKEIEGGQYRFESSSSDSDKSKNFFDNRYHLFSLVKNKDNEIKLILDDQTHTTSPLISTIIKSDENPIINEKNSYKITLNSNVDNPTSIDDVASAQAPNVALNMYFCAFAIFNKAVEYSDISKAFEYFRSVRYNLDPRTMGLKRQIADIKSDSSCPFSDKSLCDTPNCLTTDWRDQGNIISNEKCFDDVVKYCASIDSHANDKLCTFYDLDNAKKKVAILEPEQKIIEGEGLSEEEDIVKQLRKIGLNNIHLDKSLRTNGKYSDEINQLIDKIYEQKQLNIKGISSLEDVGDVEHSPLSYEDLTKNERKPREADPDESNESNKATVTPGEAPVKSDLINLKYSDLEDYEGIMKEFDSDKNKAPAIDTKPSVLSRIFG